MRWLLLFLMFLGFLRAEGKDFGSLYQTALIAYKSHDLDLAQKSASEAAKINPTDSKVQVILGKIALEKKSYEEASRILLPIIEKQPELATAWIPAGDALVFTGKYSKAQDLYTKAAGEGNQKPEALLRKIYSYLKSKELGEAERLASSLDGFNDKTPVYYFAKAAVLDGAGKPQEADIVLKNARTLYGETVYLEYYREYLWFIKR